MTDLPQTGGAWVRDADGTLRREGDPPRKSDQKTVAKPAKKEA